MQVWNLISVVSDVIKLFLTLSFKSTRFIKLIGKSHETKLQTRYVLQKHKPRMKCNRIIDSDVCKPCLVKWKIILRFVGDKLPLLFSWNSLEIWAYAYSWFSIPILYDTFITYRVFYESYSHGGRSNCSKSWPTSENVRGTQNRTPYLLTNRPARIIGLKTP
jgi:hypothetical protein